jgi:hypothetical protein
LPRTTPPRPAIVLAQAESHHNTGNVRLAVRLLDEATASQVRGVTAIRQPSDPAALSTITAADMPPRMHLDDDRARDEWPGQYL